MTDNEIIKALECSVKNKCPECPYFHSYPCDKCRKMRTDALDLINRLQEEKATFEARNKALKTERNRLNKAIKNSKEVCENRLAEIIKRDNTINELKEKTKQLKLERDLARFEKYENDFKELQAENERLKKLLEQCEDSGEYWESKYNKEHKCVLHLTEDLKQAYSKINLLLACDNYGGEENA